MEMRKIALVTGGNKGIGFEICRQLARRGLTVLLGARNEGHGRAAASQLIREGLDVRFILVDMETPSNFEDAYRFIAEELGHLDVLVNNAGCAVDWDYKVDSVPLDMIRKTFETNFFGLIALTQRLLSLIRLSPAGRIVNQSSVLGSLTLHSNPDYGMEQPKAFAYNASKTALNAFTVHLADALRGTPIKVNSAHPGDVKTELNPMGAISVMEGARTAVELALLPPDGPSGGFFHLGQPLPW
jgi:NAD(P)-dependent dehydrogenase (short-subunit alcohol dehydrogenase family)